MRVTVVGAGVAGLTTAIELESRGHDVEVIAEHRGDRITSSVAGAVWFPYRAGESPRVLAWAHRTRARLTTLAAADREAGVDLLTFFECDDDDHPPWWADGVEVARVRAPFAGAPPAWRFVAPRAIPALFLPWLEVRLRRPIRAARVDDLAAIAATADAIVVCAGLGARALARDPAVEPLLGQVIVVEPGTIPMDVSFTDERGPAPIFYSIPRRDQACSADRACRSRARSRRRPIRPSPRASSINAARSAGRPARSFANAPACARCARSRASSAIRLIRACSTTTATAAPASRSRSRAPRTSRMLIERG